MILDYFTQLQDMPTYCARFKDWTVRAFFTVKNQYGQPEKRDMPTAEAWMYNGHFCYHPDYQRYLEAIKRCIQVCHVFGIAKLTAMQPDMLEHAYALGHPELVKTRKEFEVKVDAIAAAFASEGFPIAGMISQFHSQESERMLEAVHSLFEGYRFSTVAMAVSAIEFRLLDFMKQLTPEAELDKLTLGQLMGECLDEKKPYLGIGRLCKVRLHRLDFISGYEKQKRQIQARIDRDVDLIRTKYQKQKKEAVKTLVVRPEKSQLVPTEYAVWIPKFEGTLSLDAKVQLPVEWNGASGLAALGTCSRCGVIIQTKMGRFAASAGDLCATRTRFSYSWPNNGQMPFPISGIGERSGGKSLGILIVMKLELVGFPC